MEIIISVIALLIVLVRVLYLLFNGNSITETIKILLTILAIISTMLFLFVCFSFRIIEFPLIILAAFLISCILFVIAKRNFQKDKTNKTKAMLYKITFGVKFFILLFPAVLFSAFCLLSVTGLFKLGHGNNIPLPNTAITQTIGGSE
jgi:hypothetical protein